MASSGPITLQYRFKESWQTTWQLADDERQHSQPPQISSLPYIDQSLHIIGKMQLVQDKGIKAEFKQQRLYMDKRFDYMDTRFEESRQRFESIEAKMDAGFEDFRQRFETIEAKLDNTQNMIINSKAFRPGNRISPISKYVEGGFLPSPNPFPKTVRHFWHLRLPEERATLIQLVHYYDIDVTDWVTWDEDSQDSESESDEEDSLEAPRKTKRAVNLHPERAMEELASELSLDYERIHTTMSKADLRQAPAPTPSKRKQSPTVDRKWAKKQRDLLPEQVPQQKLTLKELLNNDRSPTKSRSSREQTEIGWDNDKSFGTWELHRPIRRPIASLGPASEQADHEKPLDESREASSKQSKGSADHMKKSEGSRKASSKPSEDATIPITSEDRRAWENRADR